MGSNKNSVELPLRDAYPFAKHHGLGRESDKIQRIRPPRGVHESVYRRALMRELLVTHDLLRDFIGEFWPHGSTRGGQNILSCYQRVLQRHSKDQKGSDGAIDTDPRVLRQSVLSHGGLGKDSAINVVAFVRGMAMFGNRRVLKSVQEELLRKYLPGVVQFLGAFDKSGNYALQAAVGSEQVAAAVLNALKQNDKLHDLRHVAVIPEFDVRCALFQLIESLTTRYGKSFSQHNCGLVINGCTWRAGLSFLSKSTSVSPFSFPTNVLPTVRILGGTGFIILFIKREERRDKGEHRISLGEPTRAVDKALSTYCGRSLTTTSRTGNTIKGLLQKFQRSSGP